MTRAQFELLHLGVEAVLAALLWVLYRRWNAARRESKALEAAQAALKQRSEAGTAGLHLRLLGVERKLKSVSAAPPRTPVRLETPQELPRLTRAAAAGAGTSPQLSAGEMNLLMKVRQLRRE